MGRLPLKFSLRGPGQLGTTTWQSVLTYMRKQVQTIRCWFSRYHLPCHCSALHVVLEDSEEPLSDQPGMAEVARSKLRPRQKNFTRNQRSLEPTGHNICWWLADWQGQTALLKAGYCRIQQGGGTGQQNLDHNCPFDAIAVE